MEAVDLELPGVDEPSAVAGEGGRPRVTCRLCGRPLHGREARLWGLGPDCRAKLALRQAPRPPERPVEQDPLPGV
ncbi:DUF6011 domain-containing protein [Streptomyces millisiae]|uniref:DUF6011 domain-containing protein n=1 Tax=Streptomyces millisiae TaxID=3075542 RepID=A0ABU2LVX5_9ACTN|nr:DUF6011 domain-containing protein [Streptomyces sp. DSM 44918]MDT0321739.1 DUF6011 domain-containing protein [Streptomyces sp. DSM 44918]